MRFAGAGNSDSGEKTLEMPRIGSDLSRLTGDERKALIEDLRVGLVNAQYRLKDAGFPVLVLLAGRDRIGCEQVIDRLHQWMDGRYLDTWFLTPGTDEERSRPRYWRFWRVMPPEGRTGLFAGGWVLQNVGALLRHQIDEPDYFHQLSHATSFERLLVDDGALLLKIWLDLPAEAMRQRLEDAADDPLQARYAEDIDWTIHASYEETTPLIDRMLSETSKVVPWQIVDGLDAMTRDLAVAGTLRQAMEWRLDVDADIGRGSPTSAYAGLPPRPVVDHLSGLPLDKSLPYEKYRRKLDKLQVKLHRLSLAMREKKQGCVLVFEGWDAAGKGGTIRRITQAISARDCKVIPVGAPTDEELAHHYLWRFWRRLPADGQMRIFDRSWYGRVLVERVEALASEPEWRRAYDEINDFESQLIEHGNLVLKFWLHIDPEEQLRRFEARKETPYKKYKLTAEDHRNREQWPEYTAAVNEMVTCTDTEAAPWILVPANDKRYARVKVVKTLCKSLKSALGDL